MYRAKRIETDDKPLFYRTLTHLLEQLLEDETDRTANLCNAAALLGHSDEGHQLGGVLPSAGE